MDCFNIQDESNLKLNSSLFSLIKLPRIKTSILLSFSMLISWRPFSSDCGMLLHLTQNSRKKLSGNQSGYISDGFMRKSAHKCANLTKPLRLQISCIFSTFVCKFVSCAFFVIVFVLVRQTSLTAKMGFMGISAQNSKMD